MTEATGIVNVSQFPYYFFEKKIVCMSAYKQNCFVLTMFRTESKRKWYVMPDI